MDPQKAIAEIDLPGLFEKRTDAAKRQKWAADWVKIATGLHFFVFFFLASAAGLSAVRLYQTFPDNDPGEMFWLAATVCLVSVALIFFPRLIVGHFQDKASAASRQLKDIEGKISFCHQVLEEAKKVKVRKYAEVWVEKETP